MKRRAEALLASALMLQGCGSAPAGPTPPAPPPPPPATLTSVTGVWTFATRVTHGTGECSEMVGQSATEQFTISQAGAAAPYELSARGLGSISFRGTLSTDGELYLIATAIPAKFYGPPGFTLSREGSDRLVGTGDVRMQGGNGCDIMWDVVATRGTNQ